LYCIVRFARVPLGVLLRGNMRRYYLPLATLILVVAAVLRLWLLHLYPPGPHYDEGAYLLITRSIAFGGARFFPIVEAYQGREVLYMYLNAPLLHLFGNRIYTLHLASAFINLITVAAAIRLARSMFRGERGIVVALAIGIVAALSFPQVFIARQAFRAVTLPMMQALALLFLWRGITTRRGWLSLALGGFFAGGTIYTYMASRLFPFWLLFAALVVLWADRAHWRLRLRQGLLFFGVLAVTAAPMAVYALQKPDIFWGRLGEVTQVDESVTLAESVLLHLRMFFIEGDPYLRYNVPGRPYFTPLEGALMLIGIIVAARRLLSHRTRPTERAAYALALLSPLMVIPSVISVGGLPPSHMRSLGMIPLIFVLVGVGFESSWTWLAQRWQTLHSPRALPAMLLVCLLMGGVLVGQLYFEWAGRADLFYETDADLSLAARWLAENTGENERIYLAARDRSHPTVLIEQTPPITWLGTDTLYRAPAGASGLYVFPRSAPPPQDWLAWLERGRINDLPLAPDERTAFEAFRLDVDTPLPASDALPSPAPRNDYLTLVGIQASPIAAGSSGEVVTQWRIERAPQEGDLTPILQVEDAQGFVLSRADLYITDTNLWEQGAVIFLRLPITIPLGTLPSRYSLRVAWVAKARDSYTQYVNAEGRQSGIWAEVGSLEVLRPAASLSPADIPMTAYINRPIAPDISLVGYDTVNVTLRPGESLPLRLLWSALKDAPPTASYRLVLRGADSDTLLYEAAPLTSVFPSSEWRVGDIFTEQLRLMTAPTQAAGDYTLLLITADNEISLGSVTFQGIPRLYTMPNIQNVTDVVFADSIRLTGYTLTQTQGALNVELVWQSMQSVTQPLTVFIHVLDSSGDIITQQDAMPQQNSYPTDLWLPSEYIVDNYRFDNLRLNPAYLRIGLYQAVTGERLTISNLVSKTDHIDFVIP
jgi:4-amino-4-deoxy-L-arabinose transferase-like glycosyltransferase